MQVIASEPEVLEALKDVLSGFEVAPDDVSPQTSFETLGLDSLDLVEISVKIEDVYGIDIEEEDLKEVTTIGDAVALVIRKVEARA
jgi:acyl carrier protein